MNLISKEGIFREKDSELWKKYSGQVCTVIKYDDESQTGVIVEFDDGKRLVIQTEEFELIVN